MAVLALSGTTAKDRAVLRAGRRTNRWLDACVCVCACVADKYHVSRLSKIYTAPSKLDNFPPYTVIARPPFYTSPEDLGQESMMMMMMVMMMMVMMMMTFVILMTTMSIEAKDPSCR
jgi:hypothetical protein